VNRVTADRPFANAGRGVLERSTSDLSTRELLQQLFTGDVVDLDQIAQLIDMGKMTSAVSKPDALASMVELPHRTVEVVAAAFEIARRASIGSVAPMIRGPADVATIAQLDLGARTRECVLVVACDAGNNVLRTIVVAQGSVDIASVPVREILNAVLRCDGRAFAVAHNHPAGVREASAVDVSTTDRLSQAARAVGLRFLGHVVVAGDDWLAVASRERRILGSAVTEQSLPAARPT
jgi:DNA repair protein RadC